MTGIRPMGDMTGVGGLDRRTPGASRGSDPVLSMLLDLTGPGPLGTGFCWPPPESTVNGPFLLPGPVFHAGFSIFPGFFTDPVTDAVLAATTDVAPEVAATGLGRSGRNFVLVEVPLEAGEPLEDAVDRGEGPLAEAEGEGEVMMGAGEMMDTGKGGVWGVEGVDLCLEWREIETSD